ncbi:enoyl-CoA-hydratase DpgD [Micromonospora sp. KC207]|uniref:enoyl-CoA-hydratase DpgD n=1 Tax=Micromonospora sp. KC207 TaxID=2530377 RepID=UPI001A9DB51C|nr:enoyl-CoA-hydratase DpgD [Micromonospora sp. KC207]
MSDDARVRYELHGGVARVTIDRPAVLNAMDRATHAELGRIWDEVERDDEVRVVVLTGAGDRSFSVGQDLKELAVRNRAGTPPTTFGSRGQPGWPRLTERFRFSKPLIARVNGYALGGGFELALACDLVIAAEHAEFGLPEARLGLVPGAGGVFRLARQAPFRIALGHLLTGRRMSAADALRYGLVNEVVPAAGLDACVDGWVRDVLSCSPLAVRAIKEAATASVTMPLQQAFATRFEWEERRLAGDEWIEGPRAFAEKRRPRW